MVDSLQGEDYLNQEPQQGAYGTPSNPAQAPTVQGGWGGILLSGATALAGIATDNPYAVAFGSDMGQSYHDSYDTLNKSLIDEQRATRLADSSLARQKNLAQWQRDLTQGDRDQAQENLEETRRIQGEQWQAGNTLAQQQEARLAESSKLQNQLTEAQLAEAKKTPKQRAEEAAEAQRILMTMQAEVTANQTTAANNAQIANLDKTLTDLGVSDEVKTQAVLKLRLKQAGIDMKGTAKAFTGEQKVKLQQVGATEFKERDEYTAIAKEQSQEAADKAAAAYGIQYANAVETQLNTSSGGGLAATILADIQGGGDGGGGGGGESQMGQAISAFYKGQFTAQQLLAGADTPEEKAAAQEAINLAAQEDAVTGTPTPAQALTGELDTEVAQEETSDLKQELQYNYDNSAHEMGKQDILQEAQAAGIQLDVPEPSAKLSERERANISSYVSSYNKADTAAKSRIVKDLQKGLSAAAFDAFMRGIGSK